MKDSTVRRLIEWQATRQTIDLDRIRIGHNQKQRYGSATAYNLARDNERFTISVSNYVTDSDNEEWNTIRKVNILDTILHEFAHLVLFSNGHGAGHGERFIQTYHGLLASEWQKTVQMYNLLEGDCLSDDWSILKENNRDSMFDSGLLDSLKA